MRLKLGLGLQLGLNLGLGLKPWLTLHGADSEAGVMTVSRAKTGASLGGKENK